MRSSRRDRTAGASTAVRGCSGRGPTTTPTSAPSPTGWNAAAFVPPPPGSLRWYAMFVCVTDALQQRRRLARDVTALASAIVTRRACPIDASFFAPLTPGTSTAVVPSSAIATAGVDLVRRRCARRADRAPRIVVNVTTSVRSRSAPCSASRAHSRDRAAGAVVERLAHHEVVAEPFERVAGDDAGQPTSIAHRLRFVPRRRADVDEQVGERERLRAVGVGGDVRRQRADDAAHDARRLVPLDGQRVRGQDARVPAAERRAAAGTRSPRRRTTRNPTSSMCASSSSDVIAAPASRRDDVADAVDCGARRRAA